MRPKRKKKTTKQKTKTPFFPSRTRRPTSPQLGDEDTREPWPSRSLQPRSPGLRLPTAQVPPRPRGRTPSAAPVRTVGGHRGRPPRPLGPRRRPCRARRAWPRSRGARTASAARRPRPSRAPTPPSPRASRAATPTRWGLPPPGPGPGPGPSERREGARAARRAALVQRGRRARAQFQTLGKHSGPRSADAPRPPRAPPPPRTPLARPGVWPGLSLSAGRGAQGGRLRGGARPGAGGGVDGGAPPRTSLHAPP